MNPTLYPRPLSRREFAGQVARGALLAGAALVAGPAALAAQSGQNNPFAYDLSRLSQTDPKLVRYEETGRFRCPHAEPRRVAVGPGDALFVAAGNYVTALGAGGASGLEIALSGSARCVAVAKDGTIYAGLRDHVEVFDAKGQRRATWETPGGKPWFTGLAVGENDVFAADAGNRVLFRFDRSGKLVRRLGEKNKERGVPGFIVPSPYLDVELGPDGLLHVNNPGRHRVEAYTFDGDFEGGWGKPTAAIDGFCGCCNPIGLAALPEGRIVTCEKGLPRVKVYGAQGEFDSVVAGTDAFPENAKVGAGETRGDSTLAGLDAAADSQGRIYILDFVTGDIRVMKRKA